MEIMKKLTEQISMTGLIGWIGILVLAILKEFIPSLSFLTSGFVGLILLILFLSLTAQPLFKKKKDRRSQ